MTLILLLVILPVVLIAGALVDQATTIFGRIQSGELDFGRYLSQIVDLLPVWAREQLERLGLMDLGGLQKRLAQSASQVGQYVAPRAINLGQTTLHLAVSFGVMMYLLFFLLRDGASLARSIRRAIPLGEEDKRSLLGKFATVIRATVKGNIAVAITQGFLGGVIFWALGIQGALLWATLMAFLSLLPAIGAGLIWGPVALYFLATGSIWQGIVLIAFGVFVIGLVDNILRPILVGKDTKIPDYVVLISTLGGLALVGINGFVIGPLIAAMFIASWDLFGARDEDPATAWDSPLAGDPASAEYRAIGADRADDKETRLENARKQAAEEAEAARKEARDTEVEVEMARDVAQKAAEEAASAEKDAEKAADKAAKAADKSADKTVENAGKAAGKAVEHAAKVAARVSPGPARS